MKLRVRGDSLRLRLTQSEVTRLVEVGKVEESVAFGGASVLTYALVCKGAGSTVKASLDGARIEVSIAADVARAWASNDTVGIEGAQDASDGRKLRILVEKDFACLKERPDEDDSDAFPNPKETCAD